MVDMRIWIGQHIILEVYAKWVINWNVFIKFFLESIYTMWIVTLVLLNVAPPHPPSLRTKKKKNTMMRIMLR